MAKRVRREALRKGDEDDVHAAAEKHFGLRTSALTFAKRLETPLYEPLVRSDNS